MRSLLPTFYGRRNAIIGLVKGALPVCGAIGYDCNTKRTKISNQNCKHRPMFPCHA